MDHGSEILHLLKRNVGDAKTLQRVRDAAVQVR
jgi:hypothetical protein